jgi:hypothetical protein
MHPNYDDFTQVSSFNVTNTTLVHFENDVNSIDLTMPLFYMQLVIGANFCHFVVVVVNVTVGNTQSMDGDSQDLKYRM